MRHQERRSGTHDKPPREGLAFAHRQQDLGRRRLRDSGIDLNQECPALPLTQSDGGRGGYASEEAASQESRHVVIEAILIIVVVAVIVALVVAVGAALWFLVKYIVRW